MKTFKKIININGMNIETIFEEYKYKSITGGCDGFGLEAVFDPKNCSPEETIIEKGVRVKDAKLLKADKDIYVVKNDNEHNLPIISKLIEKEELFEVEILDYLNNKIKGFLSKVVSPLKNKKIKLNDIIVVNDCLVDYAFYLRDIENYPFDYVHISVFDEQIETRTTEMVVPAGKFEELLNMNYYTHKMFSSKIDSMKKFIKKYKNPNDYLFVEDPNSDNYIAIKKDAKFIKINKNHIKFPGKFIGKGGANIKEIQSKIGKKIIII